MLGPIFLLAPLALLGLRYPLGRRLLAAAAVFAIPAFWNVGTRFLMPSLPFLAMAMGLALQNSWGAMPALAVFHAVLCWPATLSLYCRPYAWRIGSMHVDAALRKTPPQGYIAARIGEYPLVPAIEKEVPPGGRIFSCAGRPEAYINREVLVSYESAEANLLNDILLAPVDGYRPTQRITFRFAAQPVRAVRVVQTARSRAFWTVAEMRVFSGATELPRKPEWRLRAQPNGWEVPLAFDNSAVTRWSSWEESRPGQFLETEFGRALSLSSVVLECAAEPASRLRLEAQAPAGRWQPVAAAGDNQNVTPPHGMRRDAMLEFKSRGVRHLLISETDFVWPDMRKYALYWGITELGQAGGTHFFRIE
jgi:hypothetical protein